MPRANRDISLEKMDRFTNDPATGIPLGEKTESQAAEEICRELLNAIIRDDQVAAGKLWPVVTIMSEANWQEMRGGTENPPAQILKVGPARTEQGCKLGPVVPCRVKHKDGTGVEIGFVVKIRQIDGKASCVVVGTWKSSRQLTAKELNE